jgi:uncharacterized protein YceK
MKLLVAVGCAVLVSGCESMGEKIDASRQERCHKADWTQVGERDGVEGVAQGDRYAHVCGDAYDEAAYKQGQQKGFARRPRPPV